MANLPLLGITGAQFLFCLLVFILAAADVGKTVNIVNEYNSAENFYGAPGTASVPSWMAYDLFAGIFSILTVGPACFFLFREKLYPWFFVIIEFVNFVFLIAAIGVTGNYLNEFDGAYCGFLSDYPDINQAVCTLPKALMAMTVLAWLLTLAAMGFAIWVFRSTPLPFGLTLGGAGGSPPAQSRVAMQDVEQPRKQEISEPEF